MKKIALFSTAIMLVFIEACAQTDVQTSINTDMGILTVSKTIDGRDMITINIANWDKQLSGTKYRSGNLPAKCSKKIYLEIADHTNGLCKKGIGFSCSIFDYTNGGTPVNKEVDDANRFSIVTIKKLQGSVQIIFDNNINWQSLAMK